METDDRVLDDGIEPEFFDAAGVRRVISPEVRDAVRRSLAPAPHHALVSGPVVMRVGCSSAAFIRDEAARPLEAAVYRDAPDGLHEIARTHLDDGALGSAAPFDIGLYRLKLVAANGVRDEAPLVVAPRLAFAGDFERVWVLALQLYSLRSESNWGIGDFGDLMEVLRIAARAGAAGVGLNPLHALFDDHPADCSPYSPNSRLFLNPLYIDVARAPGATAESPPNVAGELERLRQAELVDYRGVAEAKGASLRAAYARFMARGGSDERAEFEAFRAERGALLMRFACFEFLRQRLSGPWWDWPEEWRAPDDTRLQLLRDGEAASAIGYVEFLQWIAHRQLQQCKDLASDLKMQVGLYLDIAVGVKPDGFDAWNSQGVIAHELRIGAPPDLLNTAGQDWGLASYSAAGLEATLFQPYCDMLAASMRYAGAIRLDHVLGLHRLYQIPAGFSPRDGAYVRMPFDALLAATTIESQRHRCVVIGEDLGTVPDGFRERLAEHGIWCYRVMLFERDHDGAFLAPERYAADALVTFSTHDLPTFVGWRESHDLSVKRSLGLDPGETDPQRAWALDRFDTAVEGIEATRQFESAVGFLARTPSRILAISLEDLQGVRDQPNIPGTIDEHPNWRRKLPLSVEAFAAVLDTARLRELLGDRSRP
jgi:4-alpha-glucanotransferase